jgi:hypothetical protein
LLITLMAAQKRNPDRSVARVLRLRDRLYRALLPHCGLEPSGGGFDHLVDDLCRFLPNVPVAAVFDSARALLSSQITRRTARETAWRLAGNIGILRSGTALAPWRGPGDPEWHPAEFLSGRRARTRAGDAAFLYRLRLLAGPACPLIAEKSWPVRFLPVLARSLGFPSRRDAGRFRDPTELMRLRCEVMVEAEFCRPGRPGFDKVRSPSWALTWNRRLFRARLKEDPPCPHDYTHPCYRCPVGYLSCPAGTHARDYEFKVCGLCGREAPHDPGAPSGLCLECDEKQALS